MRGKGIFKSQKGQGRLNILLEQDPAATEEAASFGGKREVLAEKGQGRATTP